MIDTDLSATRAQDVQEDEILDVLEVETPEISIVPKAAKRKSDVLTVVPVAFSMRPTPVVVQAKDRMFKVDLSMRGLELGVDHVPFRHDYPFVLGLEGQLVPTMYLAEAVAEKVIGYGAFRLAKHFADLAFAVDPAGGALVVEPDVLRDLTKKKLEGFVERFPELAKAQEVSDYASLQPPFTQDRHLRTLKFQWAGSVRFIGDPALQYTFPEARALVQERLVPMLFPR